ncbi:MAG: hypothetical protein Q9M40_07925 [Sulfurimonas sp.]|nr:hypothetical protein [Sulfurimonas sp.]
MKISLCTQTYYINSTLKESQDSQLGDVFTYNMALSYKLLEHDHKDVLRELDAHEEFGYSVDVFVELNGENVERDEFAGEVAYNTGHNVVFATAGVQVVTQSSYSLFLTFSKPLYQDFHGIQNDIGYKSSIGIGKSF